MKNQEVTKIKLYDFQKDAVRKARVALRDRGAFLNACEQGLGKTLQGLYSLRPFCFDSDGVQTRSIVIVCPSVVKSVWRDELFRYAASSGLDVSEHSVVVCSTKSQYVDALTEVALSPSTHFTIIVSYALFAMFKESKDYFNDLFVVFDEAHFLKSEKSKRTKRAYDIKNVASYVLFLTGTPVPNSVVDIYPLCRMVAPDVYDFRNFYTFAHKYTNPRKVRIGNGRTITKFEGGKNLKDLKETLDDHVWVRLKKDEVLKELPSKTISVVSVEAERANTVKSAELSIPDAIFGEDDFLNALAKDEHVQTARKTLGQIKANQCAEYIKLLLESQECVVVFAYYRDTIALLSQYLDDSGISFTTITGDTSSSEREASVKDFQDGKIQVLLGQVVAAGTGITLTRASNVVFCELSYVPADFLQASDRVHRISQESAVNVHVLNLEGSKLDNAVWYSVKNKIKTIEELENA